MGAGASLPAPAALPLFHELRRALCEWMGVDDILTRNLPPEVFMHCVARSGEPLAEWIADVLGAGEPNSVHAVLARSLLTGSVVWCLNVDELIEREIARLQGRVPETLVSTMSNGDALPAGARLLKPHGTVSLRNFVFQSGQVIRPFPTAWTDRLKNDFRAADTVVFVGYRGADIDLRGSLNEALLEARADSVAWFCKEKEEWEQAKTWLPALSRFERSPFGENPLTAVNPSEQFVKLFGGILQPGDLTDVQLAGLSDSRANSVTVPLWRASFARALLLERLSQSALAEDAFLAEILRGRHFVKSFIRYAKLRWYVGDSRFEILRKIDSTRPGHLSLGPVARKVRRAHIMYLSSELGDQDRAVTLAEHSDRRDPATWIVLAKGWRYQGRLSDALRAADQASDLAAPKNRIQDSRVDEKAHAVFEAIYSCAWMGQFAEAERRLVNFCGGYDEQANVRWTGWARYLKAGLELLGGRAFDAMAELESAITFFESDDGRARRRSECYVLLAAIHRFLGLDDQVKGLSSDLDKSDRPAFAQLERTRQFELGEIARSKWQFGKAIEHYRAAQSPARPYVHVAALLGGVEASFAGDLGDWHEDLSAAERIATSCGLGHLIVQTTIVACRTGSISGDVANERLDKMAACVPGWLGPNKLERVLSGLDEHHIFCLW
ncbi:MAG: SIR2 family protein [Acidimicrobiales bacterium]